MSYSYQYLPYPPPDTQWFIGLFVLCQYQHWHPTPAVTFTVCINLLIPPNFRFLCHSNNLCNSIDTGSSDIWVESADSSLCMQSTDPCEVTGTFNYNDSSTYTKVANDFSISYVDGEYAKGDYGKDTFGFAGGINVTGLQFGIGLSSSSTEGIMGIGFSLNEVQVQRLGKDPYRNLVDVMVDQGLIKSRAYSLWLNDLGTSLFHTRRSLSRTMLTI